MLKKKKINEMANKIIRRKEMQRMENVKMKMSMLRHHPDNPRKQLGDLEELIKSIEKNGILQNLTIIPVDENGEDCSIEDAEYYYVLIGNRRFEAGHIAGLRDVTCNIIEGLTKKEQMAIMLEENMQRSDLTPIEEAEGFQMMLDLGETIESLEKKTGFSKSTIHHRVNIAKLDKDTLRKKEFQISLTDLYALEQVSDIETRNKILEEAYSSNDIRLRAERAAIDERIEKNIKAFKEGMMVLGIKEDNEHKLAYWNASSDIEADDSEWLTIAEINMNDTKLNIPEFEVTKDMLYAREYGYTYIIARPHPNYKEYGEREETPEEKAKREKEEAKKRHIEQIKEFQKQFRSNFETFAYSYICGEIKKPIKLRGPELVEYLWRKMLSIGGDVSIDNIAYCYYNMENDDRMEFWNWKDKENDHKELYHKKADALLIDEQIMMSIAGRIEWIDVMEWSGKYKENEGRRMQEYIELMERFEIEVPDYIKQVFDGTHDYYK